MLEEVKQPLPKQNTTDFKIYFATQDSTRERWVGPNNWDFTVLGFTLMVWLKFGRGISWVMKSVFNEQVSAGSTLFVQNWSPFDSINLFTLFHIEYSLVIQQSLSNNHHCHQSKTSSNMIGLGEYKNIWCPFLHPYLLPDIFCCGRCGERLWGGNFSHVEKF